MAHVIYDKTTNQPLMIVVNPSPVHEAHLEKLCQREPDKGLHVIDHEKYKECASEKDICAAIVAATKLDLTDS